MKHFITGTIIMAMAIVGFADELVSSKMFIDKVLR